MLGSGLGSSKVLVLGTWYLMQIIEYLVLTCTWPFWIQKYLVLTCTWWPKYLILVQVLKYFCQINKYSCFGQQFTTEHHKQKWFILVVLTAWVSGCQQPRLDCLLEFQAQRWDPMTQYWQNSCDHWFRKRLVSSLVQATTTKAIHCTLKPLELEASRLDCLFDLQAQKVL